MNKEERKVKNGKEMEEELLVVMNGFQMLLEERDDEAMEILLNKIGECIQEQCKEKAKVKTLFTWKENEMTVCYEIDRNAFIEYELVGRRGTSKEMGEKKFSEWRFKNAFSLNQDDLVKEILMKIFNMK